MKTFSERHGVGHDSTEATSEADLAYLLAFVRGEGVHRWTGKGITTHPQAEDKNQQRLHTALLILEQRGDVRRHYVSPEGSVTWSPST